MQPTTSLRRHGNLATHAAENARKTRAARKPQEEDAAAESAAAITKTIGGTQRTDAQKTPVAEASKVSLPSAPAAKASPEEVATMRQTQAAKETLREQALKAQPPSASPVGVQRGLDGSSAPSDANGVVREPPLPEGDFEREKPTRQDAVSQMLKDYAPESIPNAGDLEKRLQADAAFSGLPPDTQGEILKRIQRPDKEGQLSRALVQEALTDPELKAAPPEEKANALYYSAMPELPLDAAEAGNQLDRTPAFGALPKKDQASIKKTLGAGGATSDAMVRVLENANQQQPTDKAMRETLGQLKRIAEADTSQLDPDSKMILADTYANDRPPFANSKVVEAFSQSKAFSEVATAEKPDALVRAADSLYPFEEKGSSAPPPTAEGVQATLDGTEAYKSLDATAKDRVDRLLLGTTPYSEQARSRFEALTKTPMWKEGGTSTRAEMLRQLPDLDTTPYGVDHLTPSEPPRGKATITGTRDAMVTFEDGETAPATEYDVAIKRNGQTFDVKVQIAKKPVEGRIMPTLDQVKNALARLPDDQLESLKAVVVNADGSEGSGMSTTGEDGRVHISPAHSPKEAASRFDPGPMSEILNHEVGHLQSITPWGNDETAPEWKAWDAIREKDGLHPSQYGTQNGPEDFAETYALYRSLQNRPAMKEEVRKLFPNRFAAIEKLLQGFVVQAP